jgi:MazG family protein
MATGLGELVALMDRLRDPGGCPWDREQTYATLRGFLIEECYEVADALDRDDRAALREELGDLLLKIVFLSRLAKEEGHFTIEDVVRGIVDKMVRRHPHVFGSEKAEDAAEVLRNWEEIKRKEKTSLAVPSLLDGIPRAMPAVQRARMMGDRAARIGFDWERAVDVLDKLDEEIGELRRAVGASPEAAAGELGDVLFAAAMAGRKLGIDPEAALDGANRRFEARFRWMEQALAREGVAPREAGIERLEALWQAAKAALA